MAAPAALVIAKILQPETEQSVTAGDVKMVVEKTDANGIDALLVAQVPDYTWH